MQRARFAVVRDFVAGVALVVAVLTPTSANARIVETGVSSHLTIEGDGFFIVRDPVSGECFATRCGSFQRTAEGHLELVGLRLQGYSTPNLNQIGDLRIESTFALGPAGSPLALSSYGIDSEGKITARLEDGSKLVSGQVLLQQFRNPDALRVAVRHVYEGIPAYQERVRLDESKGFRRGDHLYEHLAEALPFGPPAHRAPPAAAGSSPERWKWS